MTFIYVEAVLTGWSPTDRGQLDVVLQLAFAQPALQPIHVREVRPSEWPGRVRTLFIGLDLPVFRVAVI